MYYLYLDESGDQGRRIKEGKISLRSTTHFTVAGIIISDDDRNGFNRSFKKIMKEFECMNLPQNFKLHYNPLRFCNEVYTKLSKSQKLVIEDIVLSTIKNSNCHVISVTIDLTYFYNKYPKKSISPLNYALLLVLKRFQQFLQYRHANGTVYYEQFSPKQKKKLLIESKSFVPRSYEMPLDPKILDEIKNGDPTKEPMLAFADFFAYIVYSRKVTHSRWKEFERQYFGIPDIDSSNIEIE